MANIAVVTGANSGIGLATALRLAADGYRVYAGARRPDTFADIEAAATAQGRSGIEPIAIDVTDDASVAEAFATVLENGPVSVLVNNAGVAGLGAVEETPVDQFARMLDANLLGVIRCTQQALPGMREAKRGWVVNMSSATGILGQPLMGSYTASKFALEGLSEALQAEVAPHGIRVLIIRPGTIMTPIWNKGEAPGETAYPVSAEFLMAGIMHNLTHDGVGPEAVADVIGDAIASDTATLRHVVGNADAVLAMRNTFSDEEIFGAYALEGEAFRDRYRELSGRDYWA